MKEIIEKLDAIEASNVAAVEAAKSEAISAVEAAKAEMAEKVAALPVSATLTPPPGALMISLRRRTGAYTSP